MGYGDKDLRLGDSDADMRWGGAAHSAAPAQIASGPQNSVASAGVVRKLQQDLERVGIRYRQLAPDGRFDRETECAVREFQIYAKMATVAKEDLASAASAYVERLSPIATGAHQYAGPVSGVLNAATRRALEHWITNDWRCPVVLDVFDKSGALAKENVWRASDADATIPRVVHATDLSGYYRVSMQNGPLPVGYRVRYKKSDGTVLYGPQSTDDQTIPGSEVTPLELVGRDWSSLTAQEKTKFRLVRAVSEAEAYGVFDSLNAYDPAILSAGIYHFTYLFGYNGELINFMSQFRTDHASEYERLFRFFGVDIAPSADQFKRPTLHLQTESGYEQANGDDDPYMRSWHWFYRHQMSNRESGAYRLAQWKAAHERLGKIEDAWVNLWDLDLLDDNPTNQASEIFRSELSMGLLLRWHVNMPGHVVTNRRAKPEPKFIESHIRAAIRKARADAPDLPWDEPPSQWTDAQEDALCQGLLTVPPSNKDLHLDRIVSYPNFSRQDFMALDPEARAPLSRARNSYP